jgi:hypothetical protein
MMVSRRQIVIIFSLFDINTIINNRINKTSCPRINVFIIEF